MEKFEVGDIVKCTTDNVIGINRNDFLKVDVIGTGACEQRLYFTGLRSYNVYNHGSGELGDPNFASKVNPSVGYDALNFSMVAPRNSKLPAIERYPYRVLDSSGLQIGVFTSEEKAKKRVEELLEKTPTREFYIFKLILAGSIKPVPTPVTWKTAR